MRFENTIINNLFEISPRKDHWDRNSRDIKGSFLISYVSSKYTKKKFFFKTSSTYII